MGQPGCTGGGLSYHDSRRWSDQYADHVKALMGILFASAATELDDQQRNTDFRWYAVAEARVAARVRAAHQRRYLGEVTIRSWRRSGVRTEIDKIAAGYGDYLIYGFASDCGRFIAEWIALDLASFRPIIAAPYAELRNRRGESGFRVYRTASLPPAAVYAAFNWPLTPAQAAVARLPTTLPCSRSDLRPHRIAAPACETLPPFPGEVGPSEKNLASPPPPR